jgi:hypothetical protein
MLHELYLLDPQRTTTERVFRVACGLAAGLIIALIFGLLIGVSGGLILGLILGLLIGLANPAPSVRTRLNLLARMRYAASRGVLLAGLFPALVIGLFSALFVGLRGALFIGLLSALGGVIAAIGSAGTEVVRADPPRRFAHAQPDAVLSASAASGLTGGLVTGLMQGLTVGLAGWLVDRPTVALTYGLTTALIGGLFVALLSGLNAWLYHYCLRGWLRARGLLPARLPGFFEWCARDERAWLRITEAYEFRHRELLEYLAPPPPRD